MTGSSQKIGADAALAFTYTYNKAGGLETETYPSGRQVKTCYDQAGRPKSVQNVATSAYYANSITYGPHGAVSSLPLGNGVTESWSYLRMQPTSVEAVLSGSSKWKLENFYCPSQQGSCTSNNGNVISQRLTAPKTAGGTLVLTQAYGYDSLNRLSSAAESGSGTAWSQGYTLDRYGNLTPTGDQPAPSLACGSYSSSTNRCTTSGFGYDSAGNETGFPGSRTATYDAEGRQATLTDSGTTYTYTYDGDGRRVKKVGGGVTTVFVYDAFGKLAAEYSTAAESSPCATCYLTADHLGSTRMMTNQSGTPVRRYDYFPFGQEIASGYGSRTTVTGYTTDTLNPKFTGKPRDYESGLGLDYFGARYFSAAQGRFTSPDKPFNDQTVEDPQSWNLYSYVRNNPLRYTDPTGGACFDGRGWGSCGNYILGGLKAVGNIPSDIINAPNRLTNTLISPFTDFRFPDAIPQTFTATNVDQEQGMEAAQVVMIAAPVAELGATKVVETIGTGAKVETGVAGIAPKVGEAGGPGAGKAFPNSVKEAARTESNNTCVFCGQPTQRTAGPAQSNIDHAIPKSRGGNNTLPNAQNTCRNCNLDKGTRTTREYEEELRRRQQQN